MSKIKQGIILFVEPCDEPCGRPLKVGNSLMNRFAVDEDAAFEILKIFELEKTSEKMSYPYNSEYLNFKAKRNQKGLDLIIVIHRLVCFRITVA